MILSVSAKILLMRRERVGGKACLYVIIILRASEKEMWRWKGAGANQEGDKRLKSSLENKRQ